MTPAELITTRLKAHIENFGATIPVQSLLLQAIAGEKKSVASSGIALNVHISGQLEEPLPHYQFAVSARLVVSIDDDKTGDLFKRNYDALWAAFDCFAVDGFQLSGGDEPDFQADENGGTWVTTFTATLTGRAN